MNTTPLMSSTAVPANSAVAAAASDPKTPASAADGCGPIPPALDRAKGRSLEDIQKQRELDAAIAATAPKTGAKGGKGGGGSSKEEALRKMREQQSTPAKPGATPAAPAKGSTKQPASKNLTEADKAAIAELQAKAGTAPKTAKGATPAPAKPKGGKSSKPAPAPKPKKGDKAAAAPKAKTARKDGNRSRYDWNGAREAAAKGTIPAAPDFSANTHRSYRPMLAEVEKLVKAKDLPGLQAYRVKGTCSSPSAVKKYREIAIIALKAKAGA